MDLPGPSNAPLLSPDGLEQDETEDIQMNETTATQCVAIDDLEEDALAFILEFLSFKEKVKCQRVSHKWNNIASRLVKAQRVLGDSVTNVSVVDSACTQPKHYITSLDIVPKRLLTNLSVLPKILQKCPELKALAITRSNEQTFQEMANHKRQAFDPRTFDARFDPDEDDLPDGDMAGAASGIQRMMVFQTIRRGHRGGPLQVFTNTHPGESVKKRRPPEPRPTQEDDFLDVVAKYAPRLECIDISGLKMPRGHSVEGDDAGSWKSIILGSPNLEHIKTFNMRDKELQSILRRCQELTEVSIVYGLKGDHLNEVGPNFKRLSITSIKEFGLQKLVSAPDLSSLQELTISNANRPMVALISDHLQTLQTLNISLNMYNIRPIDMCSLSLLTNLKNLYIKRRKSLEPLEEFDRPLSDIIFRCKNLRKLRLTNLILTDSSLKHLSYHCPEITDLRIELTTGRTDKTLSDKSLHSFSDLRFLKSCHIDYPNIFTENTLVEFIFRAFNLKNLLIRECKELIPIRQMAEAALKQARSEERRKKFLKIDIDTREKMEMESLRGVMRFKPNNLLYRISTGLDYYSSDGETSRKVELRVDDFDEHQHLFLMDAGH